jgi:TolB-like protein/DNA-binding winged helix-turn-helix (wHTH) protein/Flp pilus assembly protein TadD
MLGEARQVIEFDSFVLDLEGRRLLHAGEPVALEPKAFDVLALLAGSPGRALTRDEILDAVWGHRHVTPGVLNRIMTLLRHALGEDAQRPRFLHTLHGVGYRFDLPPAPAAAVPAEPPVPAPTRGTDPVPAASRHRWGRLAAGLAAACVLAALGAWYVLRPVPAPARAPTVATATPPALIVMPLTPIGPLDATRDIAAGLSDELITELARIQGLRVIARESTSLASSGSRDLASLVRQLQVTHALEGSLSQSGERLRMRLRLLDVRDGSAVWTQDYDREAADVLALQQDVARSVAGALTLKLGLSTTAARGGDANFLRRYYAARAVLYTPQATRGEPVESAELALRALLRERPDDARVRATLAAALEARAFSTPALAAGIRAEAAQEAAIALQADPTLADALRVQASAACREERWEECLSLYERADRFGPNESKPRFSYAMALASLGYLDRAEAILRERLEHDPLSSFWRFGVGRLLDTRGRHEEARRVLPSQARNNSPYGRIFNAIWLGDLERARQLAETMEQSTNPGDRYVQIFKPSYVAVVSALRDPAGWPKARAVIAESERETGLMNFLRVFDPQSTPEQLILGLEASRRRSYSTWDLLMWTRDLAPMRQDPAFAAYLRRSGILDYWKRHGFPPQCRPRGDGASCD